MTTQLETCRNLARTFLYKAVSMQSGLPEELLDATRHEQLISQTMSRVRSKLIGQDLAFGKLEGTLKSRMAERFVGWDEALRTLTPTWERRPIATVLAVGPTGVGKTETGKMLADLLFGRRLISLNGSEVGSDAPFATSMWTGSPPGYVGSDRGGILTNGLRASHSGVILIDELEKADKTAIQNIVLPLMGEGCITDKNNGETLYATDLIVFCTSNIAIAPELLRPIGFTGGEESRREAERAVFDALAAHMPPEVIGRFNAILCYQDLTLEAKWQIWSTLRHDLAAKIGPGTQIELNEEARRFVQNKFHNIATGARGIRDLFLDQIVPMSVGVKAGETIGVTSDGNRLGRVSQPAGNSSALQDRIQSVGPRET